MIKTGKIIAVHDNVAVVEFLTHQPAVFDVLTLKENPDIKLEVVSSAQEDRSYYCFILSAKNKIARGDIVINTEQNLLIPVGKSVLGRAIDVFGNAQDDKPFSPQRLKSIHSHSPTDIESAITPREILNTGIRAIDFFTPVLKGSKIGLVGGAGLGKTILLTELIHNVVIASNENKDSVSVFSAVGERSREAKELLENLEESKVLDNTVMVVGQMGENPAVRFRTAFAAATIAEDFRDHNTDVLFFMDNMYRFSQAGYELSTLMHAVPSEDGYQPTLPSEIGTLHEMLTSTPQAYITSIEAIYLPSDDLFDYSVRSALYYLDSYIVLSRDIYQSGKLPAIDLLASNSSAVDQEIISKRHFELYLKCKQILEQAKDIEKIVSLVGISELSLEDQTTYKRSILIENYMTQSLTVAEPQTNRKGIFAKNEQTLIDIEMILSGALDSVDPEKLLYIEKIDNSVFEEPKKTPTSKLQTTIEKLRPAHPLEKPKFRIQFPFMKQQKSYIDVDPSRPPMTLTHEEVAKIKQEQKTLEETKTQAFNLEEKYKTLLMEGAELQSKHGIQPQSVENANINYAPTQMILQTQEKNEKKQQ